MTLESDIAAVLALDEKRTPGEWEFGVHPGNHRINIIKPICFGKYVGKLPACEGGHIYFLDKGTAEFIAAAPLMTSIIRSLVKERGELQTILSSWMASDGADPYHKLRAKYDDLTKHADALAEALKISWSENYVNGIEAKRLTDESITSYNQWKAAK